VTEAIVGFVLLAAAGILGAILYEPLARWHGRRLAKASTFHCGIRVASGQHPEFGKTWRHGSATFSHGVIRFEGDDIHVIDVNSHARQPTADELSWTGFDNRIINVMVDRAVLELAVRTPQLDAIRLRLTSPPNVSG
jgi:hypothetical protein